MKSQMFCAIAIFACCLCGCETFNANKKSTPFTGGNYQNSSQPVGNISVVSGNSAPTSSKLNADDLPASVISKHPPVRTSSKSTTKNVTTASAQTSKKTKTVAKAANPEKSTVTKEVAGETSTPAAPAVSTQPATATALAAAAPMDEELPMPVSN